MENSKHRWFKPDHGFTTLALELLMMLIWSHIGNAKCTITGPHMAEIHSGGRSKRRDRTEGWRAQFGAGSSSQQPQTSPRKKTHWRDVHRGVLESAEPCKMPVNLIGRRVG